MRTVYDMTTHEFKVYIGCLIAMFLVSFCGTSTISILSDLVRNYSLDTTDALWIAQIQKCTVLATCFIAVALANKYGKMRITRIGLVLTTLSFVPLVLSPTELGLVLTRYLESIGVAMLGATLFSIVSDLAHKGHLIQVVAICSSAMCAGAVLGPIIGDVLSESLGVISVYLLPIPFCLQALFLFKGAENKVAVPDEKIDFPMHLAYIIGVFVLVFAVFDNDSPEFIPLLLVGVAFMVLFVLLHKRSKNKIFSSDVTHNRVFLFAFFMGLMYNLVTYSMNDSGDVVLEFLGGECVVFGLVVSLATIGAVSVSIKSLVQALLLPSGGDFVKKHPANYGLIGMILLLVPSVVMVVFLCFGHLAEFPMIVVIVAALSGLSYVLFTPFNREIMLNSVADRDRNLASSLISVISNVSGIGGSVALSFMMGNQWAVNELDRIYLDFNILLLAIVVAAIIIYMVHMFRAWRKANV